MPRLRLPLGALLAVSLVIPLGLLDSSTAAEPPALRAAAVTTVRYVDFDVFVVRTVIKHQVVRGRSTTPPGLAPQPLRGKAPANVLGGKKREVVVDFGTEPHGAHLYLPFTHRGGKLQRIRQDGALKTLSSYRASGGANGFSCRKRVLSEWWYDASTDSGERRTFRLSGRALVALKTVTIHRIPTRKARTCW